MKITRILIVVIPLSIISTSLFFDTYLKKEYYILFKKDGIIANYNKFNRLEGKVIFYKAGVIQKVLNFENGKREGWGYDYYSNGQIKNKRYYHLDKSNGPEFQYYQNGKLNYKGIFKNNKRFGSFYWYSPDGKLSSYSAFDNKKDPFCTFNYNSLGEITKIDAPISVNTYSIDTKTDTTVWLQFEEKNQNIKDLFVVVATPPNTRLEISLNVNNVHYNNIKIIDNVIKIENAFPKKGLNEIFMKLNMFHKNQKIIENLRAELSIMRD